MHCGETVVSEAIESAVKASERVLSEVRDGKRRRGEALEAPRRPDAEEHTQSEILGGERDDVTLLYVLDSAARCAVRLR